MKIRSLILLAVVSSSVMMLASACGTDDQKVGDLTVAEEQSLAISDSVGQFIVTVLTKISSKQSAVDIICRKASFTSGIFSIRSASGAACKNDIVAAFAELTCTPGNLEEYLKSGCHTNALAALAGKTAQTVLENAIKAGTGTALSLVCTKKDILPSFLDQAKAVCPAA